ncbi:MAG: acyl-CoA thioesterase [Rhodospirillum sp.]|nr:acyl-CoA thioesterase [Rhodospirillum sp.]MCF8490842.1 acyl-CoA thioesterase [Rhodospirillum sp.]MCF8501401.1 acyl-CoA thioesterase [Rhodospirillum sp.]
MLSATVTETIEFHHLDPMNVVWHGNYVQYLEKARSALLDAIDYNYTEMYESGFYWPIVDIRVKYLRPLRFRQTVAITATLVEFENRLKLDYLITNPETGQKLTKAQTIQVAVDKDSGEMHFRSPEILFEKLMAKGISP